MRNYAIIAFAAESRYQRRMNVDYPVFKPFYKVFSSMDKNPAITIRPTSQRSNAVSALPVFMHRRIIFSGNANAEYCVFGSFKGIHIGFARHNGNNRAVLI